MNEGIMIILSSPSGAGKTTLVKLLSERKGFVTSISHTTRAPRSNEVNGKDYHFVSIEKFEKMISNKDFLEYAKVFKNFYGTTKSNSQYDGMRPFLRFKGLTQSDFAPLINDDNYRKLNDWFIEKNNGEMLVHPEASSRKLKTQTKMISIIKSSLKDTEPLPQADSIVKDGLSEIPNLLINTGPM